MQKDLPKTFEALKELKEEITKSQTNKAQISQKIDAMIKKIKENL